VSKIVPKERVNTPNEELIGNKDEETSTPRDETIRENSFEVLQLMDEIMKL
jgi:hypothetical protein